MSESDGLAPAPALRRSGVWSWFSRGEAGTQCGGYCQYNMQSETEPEYTEYTEYQSEYHSQDWGDYGQHWGVDRVKLQFKTGQFRPLHFPGRTSANQFYFSTFIFSACHTDQVSSRDCI